MLSKAKHCSSPLMSCARPAGRCSRTEATWGGPVTAHAATLWDIMDTDAARCTQAQAALGLLCFHAAHKLHCSVTRSAPMLVLAVHCRPGVAHLQPPEVHYEQAYDVRSKRKQMPIPAYNNAVVSRLACATPLSSPNLTDAGNPWQRPASRPPSACAADDGPPRCSAECTLSAPAGSAAALLLVPASPAAAAAAAGVCSAPGPAADSH